MAEKVGLNVEECKQTLRNDEKILAAQESARHWSMKGVTGARLVAVCNTFCIKFTQRAHAELDRTFVELVYRIL